MKKVKKPQIIKPLLSYDGEFVPRFEITNKSGQSVQLDVPETKDLFEQLRIIYVSARAVNSVTVKKIEREKGIVKAKKAKNGKM